VKLAVKHLSGKAATASTDAACPDKSRIALVFVNQMFYLHKNALARAENQFMPNSKLELRERELQAQAVAIDVVGELTVGGGHEVLLDIVRKQLEAGRRLLIVNLSQCRRADSAGLGELVACLITAERQDAALRLANIPQPMRGLMKMTNLLKAFEIFETEEAALSSTAWRI
jgi:anti-sigma B factor antagonist